MIANSIFNNLELIIQLLNRVEDINQIDLYILFIINLHQNKYHEN
jgi:hypothetical protein